MSPVLLANGIDDNLQYLTKKYFHKDSLGARYSLIFITKSDYWSHLREGRQTSSERGFDRELSDIPLDSGRILQDWMKLNLKLKLPSFERNRMFSGAQCAKFRVTPVHPN